VAELEECTPVGRVCTQLQPPPVRIESQKVEVTQMTQRCPDLLNLSSKVP
jgi:hypothetical protein